MKAYISLIVLIQLLLFCNTRFLQTDTTEITDTKNSTQLETLNDTNSNVDQNAVAVEEESKSELEANGGNEELSEDEENKLKNLLCRINANGTVYDFSDLNKKSEDYVDEGPTGNLYYNICGNSVKSCGQKGGMASFVGNSTNENCIQLAGNFTVSSKLLLINDHRNNKTIIRMSLPEGEACRTDEKQKYQTTIELTCDPEAEEPIIPDATIDVNSCANKISITTKHACPKLNLIEKWNNIKNNKWILGAILVALGTFFCFFGENFLKITQVIAGGALVLIIFLYLILSNFNIILFSWQFWLVVVFAVILGCLTGWFMSKIQWLPGLVFGSLLGFVVGFFIFNLCLRFIESSPMVYFWIIVSICVVLGCLLGYYKEEEIAIISTSFVGAYAIMRGFSTWFGGFPNEGQIYELGNKGQWDQLKNTLTAVVYVYLVFCLILAAFGMYIQFKYFYDGNKKKNNKEEEKPLNQSEHHAA
jgi:hypothetical protein